MNLCMCKRLYVIWWIVKIGSIIQTGSILLIGNRISKGISLKSLLFINTMEYKGVINFGYIHDYLAFGMNMF